MDRNTMVHIMVVAQNHKTGSPLKDSLEKNDFKVSTARDRRTALDMLHQKHPALLLLDLAFPDRDDWGLVRAIRADTSLDYIPILLIAARADDRDTIFGLEIGVDDFLTKPVSSPLVVARIQALLRRCNTRQNPAPRVLRNANMVLDLGMHELRVDGRPVNLTQSEFGLICTLMGRPGVVFTRAELTEKALGASRESSGRTLDTHIKNLRRKIEPDRHKPARIQTVYGVGYRLAAD